MTKPATETATKLLPDPPTVLGDRGRTLWAQIHETYEFDPQDTNLVIEVCRTLDTIDTLAAAIAADGVMVTGSQGQLVMNGAVGELRQQQAAYARLVTMLNLNAAATGSALITATSASASAAANARWSKVAQAKRANRG
ncbi:P27 family phage terminase small subunit [Cryobacterium roopkundense]|uniref:Terminase n=1 Tax=Cryobacterium roopkundense TaxID=1001240 RepID=A0A7W8ZXD7_9MICO|nr:P27 family phage terminase small subunit [Cryobacterium roopkundense]MBB5641788.1 hypothetical protein [Cryobacterium roopkundense]